MKHDKHKSKHRKQPKAEKELSFKGDESLDGGCDSLDSIKEKKSRSRTRDKKQTEPVR